jgi:hypothetical protein
MKTNDLTGEQIESLLAWYEANHTHEEYTNTYATLLEKCLSKRKG